MFDRKYRVIIWATGPIGRAALYNVLTSDDMELAGVWVHSEEKNGKDAGDIVGLPKSGVICTNDKQKIFALQADVVMYCPTMHLSMDGLDIPVMELLESGKSVITPAGYWFPPHHGKEYVAKLEEAGLVFSGTQPEMNLMEIAELPRDVHPFMLGTQFHPELRARPLSPHPLFTAFIKAAAKR